MLNDLNMTAGSATVRKFRGLCGDLYDLRAAHPAIGAPRPWFQVTLTDRGNRHRDAERQRHVADDRGVRRAGTVVDRGTHSRDRLPRIAGRGVTGQLRSRLFGEE